MFKLKDLLMMSNQCKQKSAHFTLSKLIFKIPCVLKRKYYFQITLLAHCKRKNFSVNSTLISDKFPTNVLMKWTVTDKQNKSGTAFKMTSIRSEIFVSIIAPLIAINSQLTVAALLH